MMVRWLYDFPDWVLGVLIVGAAVGLTVGAFLATRRSAHARTLRSNDVTGAILATLSVIYGIVLGLIAVAAWNNYAAANDAIGREASALTNLFNEFQGYPEPARQRLQARVRTYIDLLLTDEWPAVQRGRTSDRTIRARDSLIREWVAFAPEATREQLLHASTFRDLREFLDARRARLSAGETGLPGPLWVVVLVGAVIVIGTSCFLRMEDERAQLALTCAIAIVLGLVIFVIVVLDHPLWGKQGLRPDSIVEASRVISDH